MTLFDWQNFITSNKNFSELNGHFLLINEIEDGLQILNDQLGLKELFFYENDLEIIFSSRLDWILRFIDQPEINLKFLNSLWNFENPLIYETLLKEVKILGPGGKARITNKGLDISYIPWVPKKVKSDIDHVTDLISTIINSIIVQKGKVNLGLSGGIDSRTLLSLLLQYEKKLWQSHTFGQNTNLDVKIANAMSKFLKFSHVHHEIDLAEADNIFGTWKDFVIETNCLMPAHSYYELNYYKLLPKNEFFIDGGKGEYLRRGLSNRLAILGNQALLDNNIIGIKKYLISSKPDFFTQEIKGKWLINQDEQVNDVVIGMPDVSELGTENWVDLYNIRYRTGNSSYPSQNRLDQIVQNLMPFIQPKILSAVFNLNAKDRENEKINQKILNHNKVLKLFPLARYKTVIPFQYNKYSCLAWGKLMSFFIKESAKLTKDFLNLQKDYLFSRFSDIDFINSPYYDKNLIINTVKNYYKGKNQNSRFVIWWMTFDQWHRFIYRK